MVEVLYDARWLGNHGIGRFADELLKRLPSLTSFTSVRRPSHPLDPWLLGLMLRAKRPKLFFSPGYNSPVGYSGDFIFTLHDLHHLRVRDNSNAAKRAYYEHIIRPACRRAAFVLTVSEYSRTEIAAWAHLDEAKIINVGNGVGCPFVPEGTKHQPGYPYILYVGSSNPHKNLLRLLEAFKISGVAKHLRLVISGKPSRPVVAQLQRLKLDGSVVFTGPVSNADLAALYRGALAFVFPSLYEGFGLPPLEAMACGVPVLTSNVCAIPEVVADAALLVDPRSTDAIAQGLTRIVEDSALRDSLRHKGFRRAKAFTWDQTAGKVQEILQKAIAGTAEAT
jgi:glycosyltransferase involved in cell wall biosynthesis